MCLGFIIINIISYLYFNIISTVIKTFLGVKKKMKLATLLLILVQNSPKEKILRVSIYLSLLKKISTTEVIKI